MSSAQPFTLSEVQKEAIALEVQMITQQKPAMDSSKVRAEITGQSDPKKSDIAYSDKKEGIDALVLKHAEALEQAGSIRKMNGFEVKAVYEVAHTLAAERMKNEGRDPAGLEIMIRYEHSGLTGINNNVSRDGNGPVYVDKAHESIVKPLGKALADKLLSAGAQQQFTEANGPSALAHVVAPEVSSDRSRQA